MLLVYLLIVERGFKTAMIATDSFSKLLATGLTAVLALQVFVIVGGVTKLIPLTGVTLPFVSYGGSSIVANFILLALLLLVSDRARREAQARDERADPQALRARAGAVRARSSAMTSYNSVINADAYRENEPTTAPADRGAAHPPRRHPRARRQRCSRARSREDRALHAPLPDARRAVRARVGYDFLRIGRAGLERERNDALDRQAQRADVDRRPAARRASASATAS